MKVVDPNLAAILKTLSAAERWSLESDQPSDLVGSSQIGGLRAATLRKVRARLKRRARAGKRRRQEIRGRNESTRN
jgi:hypothetical protein